MKRILCFIMFCLAASGCSFDLAIWLTRARAESGDAARGYDIFHHGLNDAPPCSSCHLTTSGATGFALGPNLANISERASTRVAGLTAAAYLRQSILDPRAYVVPGFRDIMYPRYAEDLDAEAVDDLIAYLLSL